MIIVSGHLTVLPNERDGYLLGCTQVIEQARSTVGCMDFHLSADPIEPGRINIFEQWDSAEAADAFRGSGPSDEQQAAILGASVFQHEVASSTSLT